MKVKNDHRSKFSNLSNWKEEAWKKKNQGFNGIRTRDLRFAGALPVRYFIFLPMMLRCARFARELRYYWMILPGLNKLVCIYRNSRWVPLAPDRAKIK